MASLATLPRRAPRLFVSFLPLQFILRSSPEGETDFIPAILNPFSPNGGGQHPATGNSNRLQAVHRQAS